MLLDAYELVGIDALAQADLGERQNRHQSLQALSDMALAVLVAAERRIGEIDTTGLRRGASCSLPHAQPCSAASTSGAPAADSLTAKGSIPPSGVPSVRPPARYARRVRHARWERPSTVLERSKGLSMEVSIGIWALFCAVIVGLLLVDLLIAGARRAFRPCGTRSSWSIFWLLLAVAFTFVLLALENGTAAGEYLTGYLIERSLSLDNLFVFALLFTFFAVPETAQRKVLFWGIIGAIVLRAGFIFAGAALLDAFHWMIYVFGAPARLHRHPAWRRTTARRSIPSATRC